MVFDNNLVPSESELIDFANLKIKDNIPDDLTVIKFVSALKTNVDKWRTLNSYYTCALMEIETKFKVLNQEFSLAYDRNPIESIKTRIKSPESLVEKMLRKKIPLNYEAIENQITDVAGIRIICSFPDDIYLLSKCLSQQDDIKIITVKDYIKNPKPNGYRGLHLIVEIPIYLQNEKKMMKVEVQLRTIAMDFWASLEHKLRYKKDVDPKLSQTLEKELLHCATVASELDEKMQDIRNKIENQEKESL